ncbi:tryptophan--tRNA ligase, mitochondrial isoform X2 [Contarinia nasturtii]|nr:tryptophan--tRNA ligase, mitochondrial isoform X2 [Contarinia nasturtii]
MQESGENVTFFIADLHSMTMPYEPAKLRENIYELIATLLACGIDSKKSPIFLQSTVPQHAELCWILSCLCTMPRLSQLPQFKEKSAQVRDVWAGLFMYPVLQAADVLIHKATHVPCGEDQLQQLQLASHLAKLFNNRFGETFPVIKPIIGQDASGRIRSLRDPTKKQSKSDPNDKSRITLRDSPDAIRKKIKRAITDFTSEVTYDPTKRPGVANLVGIHALVKNVSPQEICNEAKGLDTGKYKLVLADDLVNLLDPIRLKIEDYLKNRDYLEAVLKDGRDVASQTAETTLKEVKHRVGVNIL